MPGSVDGERTWRRRKKKSVPMAAISFIMKNMHCFMLKDFETLQG